MQQLEIAKSRLFDGDSLGVTNIKLYPGSLRNITPEVFSEQINKSLSQIEIGDYDLISADAE